MPDDDTTARYEPAPKDRHYDLRTLMDTGIQPYPNLDDDMIKVMGKTMGTTAEGDLITPIVLTGDGSDIMINGHQRCRALLKQGRTYITGNDVKLCVQATKDNALEWAVRLNTLSRDHSAETRAVQVVTLRREYGWIQAKIASAVGMTQGRVAQILKAEKAAAKAKEAADGATDEAPDAPPAKPEYPAWHTGPSKAMSGKATKKLLTIKDGMESLNVVSLDGMDDITRQQTKHLLREVRNVADIMIRRLDDVPAEVLMASPALDNVAPSTDPGPGPRIRDTSYPLDQVTAIRHVVTELDRAGAPMTVTELAENYVHVNEADLSRIMKREKQASSQHKARCWLIQRVVNYLIECAYVVHAGTGHYKLTDGRKLGVNLVWSDGTLIVGYQEDDQAED